MTEYQLPLFDSEAMRPVFRFEQMRPAPAAKPVTSWPRDAVLHNPIDNSQKWTGRGRAPRWAVAWATAQDIATDPEAIRRALATENGLEVHYEPV